MRAGDAIKILFTVRSAAGAPIDADTLPVVTAYHGGVADSGLVLVVTKLATGLYLASGVVPSTLYLVGDSVALVATYLVATAARTDILRQEAVTERFAKIDMTQNVPLSNTPNSTGDALNAARAQGFGVWIKNGVNLELMAPDGTTPVRVFVLDDANIPTSRT